MSPFEPSRQSCALDAIFGREGSHQQAFTHTKKRSQTHTLHTISIVIYAAFASHKSDLVKEVTHIIMNGPSNSRRIHTPCVHTFPNLNSIESNYTEER